MTPAETCARCGAFAELQSVAGARYCATCAAKPAVLSRDWYAGQRDVWSWLMGFAAVFSLIAAAISASSPVVAAAWAALGVSQALFRFGVRWARPLPLVFSLAGGAVYVAVHRTPPYAFVWALALTLAAWRDPVNRLYFQLHVTDEDLRELAERTENNELARVAESLAIASFLVPLLWPFAVFMAWVGVQHANPSATPPVGKAPAQRALMIALLVPFALAVIGYVMLLLFEAMGPKLQS